MSRVFSFFFLINLHSYRTNHFPLIFYTHSLDNLSGSSLEIDLLSKRICIYVCLLTTCLPTLLYSFLWPPTLREPAFIFWLFRLFSKFFFDLISWYCLHYVGHWQQEYTALHFTKHIKCTALWVWLGDSLKFSTAPCLWKDWADKQRFWGWIFHLLGSEKLIFF